MNELKLFRNEWRSKRTHIEMKRLTNKPNLMGANMVKLRLPCSCIIFHFEAEPLWCSISVRKYTTPYLQLWGLLNVSHESSDWSRMIQIVPCASQVPKWAADSRHVPLPLAAARWAEACCSEKPGMECHSTQHPSWLVTTGNTWNKLVSGILESHASYNLDQEFQIRCGGNQGKSGKQIKLMEWRPGSRETTGQIDSLPL